MVKDDIIGLIEARFSGLTRQLQQAARFVIDHPQQIALNSMRSSAQHAGVHPNAMLRLAREFGFDSYEPFRQHFREWIVSRGSPDWLGRAQSLRSPKSAAARVVQDYLQQEMENLQNTFEPAIADQLSKAAKVISGAKNIYISGARSSFSVAFYFHYVCRLFTNNTILTSGVGSTFADELRNIGGQDVMIAFSHRPYGRDIVQAFGYARESGAKLVAVTDSKVSPITDRKAVNIIVSNQSRSLVPTLLPTFAVAQALVTILLTNSGEETMSAIAASEKQLRSFGVYLE